MMKKLFWAVTLLMSLFVMTSHNAFARTEPLLRVGMEGNYPPFDFLEPDGNHVGFEAELLQAICSKIHANCQIVTQSFAGLIPGLQAGKFDMAMAAINITPERQKRVLFTDPYYVSATTLVGAQGGQIDIKDPKIFSGAIVGVQVSTSMALYAEKNLVSHGASIRTYDSIIDGLLDLANGRIDYALADKPMALSFLKKQGGQCCRNLGDIDGSQQPIAIALNKRNVSLQQEINQALKDLHADGTYDKLYKKYFVQ